MRRERRVYDSNFFTVLPKNPVFDLRFDPLFELCQKGGIMLRGENTEAQIAFIQEGEGGRIADEHFFLNTFFK